MSNKGKQIRELLDKTSAAAPDMTKPLKAIGDGSMLDGIKNIHDYAWKEGEKTGVVKGTVITICTGIAVKMIPKGVSFVKKKLAERKEHEKMGEKIYTAFSEEINDSHDEGGNVNGEDEKTEE
ncbi:MAG: hypothetical protein E6551_04130 [Lachnospiraceae bacterium]|nr:hypothetical protein [Lachnospiraceae bacterium]